MTVIHASTLPYYKFHMCRKRDCDWHYARRNTNSLRYKYTYVCESVLIMFVTKFRFTIKSTGESERAGETNDSLRERGSFGHLKAGRASVIIIIIIILSGIFQGAFVSIIGNYDARDASRGIKRTFNWLSCFSLSPSSLSLKCPSVWPQVVS